MFNSYNPYNQQTNLDRINAQINELEKIKSQYQAMPQQPAINQTFQLAPTQQNGMKYANSLEDVKKEMVYVDTPYFSKDLSVVWIKNNKNEIKTYELNEIIAKDEKDIKIDYLMAQIEELKKGINHEPDVNVDEPITDTNESKEPTNVSNVSKPTKKSK